MKKLLSLCLIFSIVISVPVMAEGNMNNFTVKNSYLASTYSDINLKEWYGEYVKMCYELGLMQGMGGGVFGHDGNITIAQAITMAARVHNIYNGGKGEFSASGYSNWYDPMVNYAVKNNIISSSEFSDYNSSATRAQMAYIFSNALPEKEFEAINVISSVPDVKENNKYAKSILKLYNAGVVNGSDDEHNFYPDDNIKRREAAAIICRVAVKDKRLLTIIESETDESSNDITNKDEAIIDDDYYKDNGFVLVGGEYVYVGEEEADKIFTDVTEKKWEGKINPYTISGVLYEKNSIDEYDVISFSLRNSEIGMINEIDVNKARIGFVTLNWTTEDVSLIGYDIALKGKYISSEKILGPGQYSINNEDKKVAIKIAFTKEDTKNIRSIKNFNSLGSSDTQPFALITDEGFFEGSKKTAIFVDYAANNIHVDFGDNAEIYYHAECVLKSPVRHNIITDGDNMELIKLNKGENILVYVNSSSITFCDNPNGENPKTIKITDDIIQNGIKLSKIFE